MIQLDKIQITPEILNAISKIESFNGAWPYMIKEKDSLRTILKAQTKIASISASSRIEGSLLRDYEVEKVLGGITSPLYRERDIKETRGYAKVYDRITEDYELIALSENIIKEFHSSLISDQARDDYRKTDKPEQNILIGEPPLENALPSVVPELFKELIDNTNTALKQGIYHPLLIVAMFMANFLSINPFGEGNGRIARLTTTLLLLKSGYTFILCHSYETIMEETRKSYIQALKKSQNKEEENSWVIYFLRLFEKTVLRLNARIEKDNYENIEDKYSKFSPIERNIIKAISDRGSLYTTELVALLSNYKTPTLKKALRALVSKEEIVMLGTGRGTYYEMPR